MTYLKTLFLGVVTLASAAAASSASAQTCTNLNGAYSCPPHPNALLSCPTSSPTNAEMAVSNGVSAACPRPPVNGVYAAGDLDARVKDVLVYSDAMAEEVWVRVILPPAYASSPAGTKFPVLYLLTGNGAGFQSWTCNTLVQNYLANANVLVVMPEGSRYNLARCARPQDLGDEAIPGWYSNWSNPSADGNPEQWETFHTEELPALLQAKFKASTTFAIAGLSMGGYGAIKYSAKNLTARFDGVPGNDPAFNVVAAASYSGMLNTVSPAGFSSVTGSLTLAGQDTNALWSYYPGTPYANTWGSDWPENNPTSLVSAFVGPAAPALRIPLFIAVGDGSLGKLVTSYDVALGSIEAAAKSSNLQFISALKTANGNATPTNLTNETNYKGTHQWRYWDAEMCRSLSLIMPKLIGGTGFTPALPCRTPY